jgi:hypothetical protein
MFKLEPSIGPTLFNLVQNGMTEQDNLGISQLVELCTIILNILIQVRLPVLIINMKTKTKTKTMEGGKKE